MHCVKNIIKIDKYYFIIVIFVKNMVVVNYDYIIE